MKKVLFGAFIVFDVVVVSLIAAYFYAGSQVDAKMQATYAVPPLDIAAAVASADLALGERIVTVRNGCVDCHGKDLSGAVVMDNPAMGQIAGPNLTPAALNDWSDADLARAIRHGIGRDQRPLVLMPSHDYLPLSEGDLAAIIAYLRSLPPVENQTPPVKLGPVAKALLAFDKAPSLLPAQIIDHQTPFASKPAEAATPDFGRYLAQSACAGCHGPQFAGGPIPGGDPNWPPASDLRVVGSWDLPAFQAALRTGKRPDGTALQAPMPAMALDDTETEALWLFLKSL